MINAANEYNEVKRSTDVDCASSHQLISLLLKNALNRINLAKRHLEDGNWSELNLNIDKSLAIIHELQGSLKEPLTNELSADLYNLYSYLTEQLIEANARREAYPLLSAYQVIETLLDAWTRISPEKQAHV